ncbi:hypothetical protein [Marinobacter sp. HL-58]|uniref:hypothetical protein n=1 Tax=Marinobacter sp. HL-58 TaxID=1479237 RepID=UPI0005605718|nr:hypothetical protein [Marinobacter sp. HL-58]KPP99449.1 MAG: outer membrane protein [Marinobacter sp. HL-58]
MKKFHSAGILAALIVAMPMAVTAQERGSGAFGPSEGEREFSISGTGSGDQDFDSGSFGVSGDLGWYLRDNVVLGVRQSVNYASIEGENLKDDFWNGATRGYGNFQFAPTERMRPFLGGSLGMIYGDGVKDDGFAGLEAGGKYYVLPKTYLMGRVEYQWFFSNSDNVDDAFRDDGAFAYTLGMGYNF